MNDLKILGARYTPTKQHPNKWNIPIIGDIIIKEETTMEDILKLIYNKGHLDGVKRGKEIRSDEIMKLLK